MNKYISDALKINELKYQLKNISIDDNRPIESYSQDEIIKEVKWCLYQLETDLDEIDAEDIVAINKVKKEIKKLNNWINKYN